MHSRAGKEPYSITFPFRSKLRQEYLVGMATDPDALIVDQQLRAAGWVGAFDGVELTVRGFGDVALQYRNQNALLRLEYHAKGPDGVSELHFHVTDDADVGIDLILRPQDRLATAIDAILRAQNELTLETLQTHLPSVTTTCAEAYVVQNGKLVSLTKPTSSISMHMQEAAALVDRDDVQGAISKLEVAVQLDPKDVDALEFLVSLCRRAGDFSRMHSAATQLCELVPLDPRAWMDMSIALQNLKRFPHALAAIDCAVMLEDDNGTLHYQRACVLCLDGRLEQAVDAIRTALQHAPSLSKEIAADSDFAALHDRADFQSLVATD